MKIKVLIGIQTGRSPHTGLKTRAERAKPLRAKNFARVGRFSVLRSLRATALASPPLALTTNLDRKSVV